MTTRDRRTYDHRLREQVWRTQDTTAVAHLLISRSTLDDWLRTPSTPVVTMDTVDREVSELRAEVLELRRRASKLLIPLRASIPGDTRAPTVNSTIAPRVLDSPCNA